MANESISILSVPRRGNRVSLGNWYTPLIAYYAEGCNWNYDEAHECVDFALVYTDLWCLAIANSYMLVGFGVLNGGNLDEASVHKDFRRRGIYKELVKTRMDYATKVLRVNEITVEPTEITRSYFERLGFKVVATSTGLEASLKNR